MCCWKMTNDGAWGGKFCHQKTLGGTRTVRLGRLTVNVNVVGAGAADGDSDSAAPLLLFRAAKNGRITIPTCFTRR